MDYLQDLFEFLKIDTTSAKGKGEEGAKFIVDYMKSHRIEAELIRHKAKNPYIYGEINVGAKKTLLIYNHYDVQPAEPLDKWNTDPFMPTVKEGKIFARGVGDDKGTLMARLQAIIEIMKEGKLNVNIKFLYEGEEEIGSPNMEEFLKDYSEKLKADYVLWEGSGRAPNNAPQIVLGVKGLLYVELRKTTSKDLHSMYAPIAQNPAWDLVYLLRALRTEDGKVLIPHFYDKVKWLSEEEKKYLKIDKKYLEDAIGQSIKDTDAMIKLVSNPTCNIDGVYAGYTGEGSKTVIPSYSFVKIDFRLVPEQDPDEILKYLEEYISPYNVEIIVHGKVRPYRTSTNSEIAKALIISAKNAYGQDPVVLPNSPGTGPMEMIARYLKLNQIADGIGVDYYGSNIHSFNENIYVDDYYKAISWMKEFLRVI
ncbi:M20/M25/M40 family metallo-hydrolase [Sulfolobus sp. S-194]|uniref:M20/M25/M40 family metallo-hydrolase n=1 Tax=Sulfolobus sp. S-194 TaxID=2512240 RepID=UPI001436D69F|nr:M20/M25/M40 family metallo-hydrolase [Sulfolobus sp. S-194]QIW23492.1 M20/M25/M40 family metallo-hydrolase [Sulfolobus sp. S-194]